MRTFIILLSVVVLTPIATAGKPTVRFGLARQTSGSSCVAIAGSLLKPDASLVVISRSDHGLQGRVKRVVKSCAGLSSDDVPGPYYQVIFRRPLAGIVAVVATGGRAAYAVTDCASNEGAHYNVWSGKPRKSKRVWHGYLYAGYDLEANCSDGEVGDVGT